jgi:hypothetical protein
MSRAPTGHLAAPLLIAAMLAAVAPARAADLKINEPAIEEGTIDFEDNSEVLLSRRALDRCRTDAFRRARLWHSRLVVDRGRDPLG